MIHNNKSNLNTKKGQLHISETIAVLFIFFILVMFGLIFYYQYQKVSFNEKQEEALATKAMEMTLKTLFLPELMCTRGEAESEDNCFEVVKLEKAPDIFQNNIKDYYFDLFGYANISVYKMYPEPATIYKLYYKSNARTLDNGTIITPREKKESYFVVTLKDERTTASKANYGFGYVKVEVYS